MLLSNYMYSSPYIHQTLHCVQVTKYHTTPPLLLSSRETYNALTNWLTDARTLASPNIVIVLVGNKKDLEADREVTFMEASRFAQENGTYLHTNTLCASCANSVKPYPIEYALCLQWQHSDRELAGQCIMTTCIACSVCCVQSCPFWRRVLSQERMWRKYFSSVPDQSSPRLMPVSFCTEYQ